MNTNVIYVKNIPTSHESNTIEQLFSTYGKITSISYPIDKKTKQPKGYAFVTFQNEADAQRALEKNNDEIEGKTLIVEISKGKKSNLNTNTNVKENG